MAAFADLPQVILGAYHAPAHYGGWRRAIWGGKDGARISFASVVMMVFRQRLAAVISARLPSPAPRISGQLSSVSRNGPQADYHADCRWPRGCFCRLLVGQKRAGGIVACMG
jgi:hypothetical protein